MTLRGGELVAWKFIRRLLHRLVLTWEIVVGADVVGVLCVIRDGGKVLFVYHTYGDRQLPQLPGGRKRKKSQESPRETMMRELKEELDLVPRELTPIGESQVAIGRRRATLHFFTFVLNGETIRKDSNEIGSYAWFLRDRPPRRIGAGASRGLELLDEHLATRTIR